MTSTKYDVVVIGAGVSGINAAYRLKTETDLNFTILESRHEIGGTWSLFRFPGVRSDSDIFTFGFPFRPWTGKSSIAEGGEILQYIKDTASEFGIEGMIQYNSKVLEAAWSAKSATWTLSVGNNHDKGERKVKTKFLIFCAGYYDFEEGHYPQLPGCEDFKGQIVQPQFWPSDLNYCGKAVAVIGSGATAATLLPNMAQQAKKVIMVQRSPAYYIAQPSIDPVAQLTRLILPGKWAHTYMRLRNQFRSSLFVYFSYLFPNVARRLLLHLTSKQLPQGFPIDPHFSPKYRPWDQRLCMVPDGDFFKAISNGKASIVTGHIERLMPHGIKFVGGEELEIDIIVQATGLKVQLLGGARIIVNEDEVNIADHFIYKGQMIDGIPNMSMCLGYTNASYTLGSDLSAQYSIHLLKYMKKNSYTTGTPICMHSQLQVAPLFSLTSGYLKRAKHLLPKAATQEPWKMRNNYFKDWIQFKTGSVKDEMYFEPVR